MYLYWLHEPAEKKRIFFVAFSAALCGYIYTYAWQIVVVVLLSTPIIFFLLKKRAEIYSFCYVFGLFIIGILPLLLYTAKQIQHPLYFETMRRIGLINTHIPIFAAVTTCMWVVLMGMFWLVLRRQNKEISIIGSNGTPFFFFVITGFAMIVVALSNIITGKDLELPQHIERFTILWLGLASTYSLYFFRSNFNVCKSSLRYLLLLFVFVALFIFGNARYLNMYGPVGIFTSSYDSSRLRDVQDIVKPLNWLKNNVETPSVIWADPNGAVNQYITMMTPHYVLYSAGGELQLVSDKELEERYLVTHYFALTEADLENDYVAYGGAGNAFHQWKTVNRKVRLCKMLHFDHFGYDCGQLVDLISWKGKSYFEGLYKKYLAEVQPNINVELKKYHVTYIIHDAVTDTRVFNPQQITGTKLVYDDGRFSIYSF
jgi:hypothetical protein